MSAKVNVQSTGNSVIDHLDLWSSVYVKKTATGRGSNGKISPYGIQKLRELILEMAVRGKLVPQDTSDEPASVLLEKIAQEEARLINEGVIKKPKKFPEIEDEEKSIDIPASWVWVRVRRIGHDWGQKKPDNDFSYIDVSAIDNHAGKVSSPSILSPAEAPSRARKIVTRGTVIYSTVRPYLKNIAVVEEEVEPEPIASTAFAILHPYAGIPGEYLVSFFRSPIFVRYVESVQTGIAYPAINDKQFYGAVFPLPPLAEQHRIVAKVDELMALCDQLEQQQTDSLQAHQTLVETLLRTLVESGDAESTQQAWNRIAENFETLFTTDESIDQLKQTILQLAVMGRLVPQDPNDEPASVLLEKIAEEKNQLVKKGEIKKPKKMPKISDEEKPFGVPSDWQWVRLQELSSLITKGSSPKWQGVEYVEEGNGILFVTSENVGNYNLRLTNLKYVEAKFNEIEPRSVLAVGDILMNIVGASIGRTAVFYLENTVANINQAVCLIRLVDTCADDLRPYLLHFLNSDFGLQLMFGNQVENARANLSMGNIAKFPVPLPSLTEQHRIVAKVDELMALCDTLKTRIQEAQTTQVHLADAVVEQAVE